MSITLGNKAPKMTWKQRIYLGIFTSFCVVFVDLFFDYVFRVELISTDRLIIQSVGFGLFSAFGFPLILQGLANKASSKIGPTILPDLEENEIIEVEGVANLFRGLEGVGGKLFITNKQLIFKSHELNIQSGQTNIRFQNIKNILKRKTGRIIDNGIRVQTIDDLHFDFVVNERERWFSEIEARIN
ncbi:MAG: hypothetical protein JXR10_05215 [Cyclobacteriaceae bacterium]